MKSAALWVLLWEMLLACVSAIDTVPSFGRRQGVAVSVAEDRGSAAVLLADDTAGLVTVRFSEPMGWLDQFRTELELSFRRRLSITVVQKTELGRAPPLLGALNGGADPLTVLEMPNVKQGHECDGWVTSK
jgi:hypothetical protein